MSARELFESDQRLLAQHLIEHATGFFDPTFTDQEFAEIAELASSATETIRAAAEIAETELRRAHPLPATF